LIANAKMSSLGEMAGGIAHEINTPLMIILMTAENLLVGSTNDTISRDEVVEATNMIGNTVNRIAKIVSGLRHFARDGEAEPAKVIALNDLLDETLSFCRERFANHEIMLDVAG